MRLQYFAPGLVALAWSAVATLPATLIYQFPPAPPKTIENLVVRPNGNILLDIIDAPEVYNIDPLASNPSPQLVYTFPNATGVAGIAEVFPDVYALVIGNYSTASLTGIPGSFSIWTLDLNSSAPVAKEIAYIAGAQTLNGMTALPQSPGTVLVADSGAGQVYRVNTITGQYSVSITSPYFKPNATVALGINGLHVAGQKFVFHKFCAGHLCKHAHYRFGYCGWFRIDHCTRLLRIHLRRLCFGSTGQHMDFKSSKRRE